MKRIRKIMKNNKGFEMIEKLIIIAIIATIAIVSIPKLNAQVSNKLDDSMNKIDSVDVEATK